MATLQIAITANLTQLSTFADELGYQEKAMSADGNIVDNPRDKKDFLQSYFKTMVVEELTKVKVRAIDNAIRDEREAEKQAFRDSVSSAITVTFKA